MDATQTSTQAILFCQSELLSVSRFVYGAYFPDLYSFPLSLSALGCEVVVSKYCSIVTAQWRAQCPQLQAVWRCWHRRIHRVMSIATNLLRHLISLPGQVDGWHSGDLIEPDLAARRELAALTPIVSAEWRSVCLRMHCKQINRRTSMPSLHFFFFVVSPHYSPHSPWNESFVRLK